MKLHITPGAALLLLVLLWRGQGALPLLLAAAIHEAGHLLTAHALGIRLRRMELDLLGAKLYPALPLPSYRAEAFLALGGPVFSLLTVLPCLPLDTSFARELMTASLSLGCFNLLPIEGFDGGRILCSLLSLTLGEQAARRLLFFTTYLSLLLLFSLSACLLLRYGEDAALAILSASLFARLFLSFDPPRTGCGGPTCKKRGFGRIWENTREKRRF